MSYLCNGQQLQYNVPLTNNGPNDATGVVGVFTIPAGLTFVSAAASTGTSYDDGTTTWTVGNLPVGTTVTLTLVYEITDALQAPFIVDVTVSGNEMEPIVINNVASTTVDRACCEQCYDGCDNCSGGCGCSSSCGGGCAGCSGCGCCTPLANTPGAPVANPANVNNAGIAGNVKAGDIPCNNCCATRYRLVAASEVNLDAVNINEETGDYSVTLTDPTLPWSFDYEIFCVLCGGCDDTQEFGGFGPATVSGNALFDCDQVAVCVNIDVTDTDTIDLTISGDGTSGTPFDISADAIVDPDGTNVLEARVTGLYVPPGVAVAFDISDGVTTESVLPGADVLLFDTGEGLQAVVSAPDTVTHSFLDTPTTGGTTKQIYVFDDNSDTWAFEDIQTAYVPSCAIETFNVSAIDGDTVNAAGTLPADNDCIEVYRNGIRQFETDDYTIAVSAFQFVEPFGNSTNGTGGEIIKIVYPV